MLRSSFDLASLPVSSPRLVNKVLNQRRAREHSRVIVHHKIIMIISQADDQLMRCMTGEMEISRSANIKAVLFDVGGVLFSPPQVAIAEVERELGLPPYVRDRSASGPIVLRLYQNGRGCYKLILRAIVPLLSGALALVFITGEPNNAFCRMERGELTLSQVHTHTLLLYIPILILPIY